MLIKDSGRRRLAGQTLRVFWFGFALLSLLTAGTGGMAYADFLAPLKAATGILVAQATEPPESTTTVTFTPQPTAAPTPSTPAGKPKLGHGGPLRFTFTGNVTAGTQVRSQTYQTSIFQPPGTSPTPSPTGSPLFPFQQQSQNQNSTYNQSSASALAEVSRRTAQTLTDVKIPVGVATVGGQVFGDVQALYSTARYSIGYAAQNFVLFGQLPMGSTLRGLEFILPSAYGQETFYEGATTGADGEIDRAIGVIAQADIRDTYIEAGITSARGYYTGKSTTFVLGAATGHGNFSTIVESAYQVRDCSISPPPPIGQIGCDGTPHGPAVQLRVDDSTNRGGWDLTLRSIPAEFVAFGTGEVFGDKFADINFHAGTNTVVSFDSNYERLGVSTGGTDTQFTETFNLGGSTGLGGYSLGVAQQNVKSDQPGNVSTQDTSGVQFQFEPRLKFAQTILGVQLTRSLQEGVAQSTSTYAVDLNKSIGTASLGLILQEQRQTQTGVLPTLETSESFQMTKQFGRMTFGFNGTVQHTISATSDAVQKTPLFTIARQLSPAISLGANFGEQILTDKLNPTANGHSRIFSIALNAPFSLGNGITTGRPDARLPATIVGHVMTVVLPGTNPTLASLATLNGSGGGLGNVAVVLDDRQVERTDLTGGFQFPFIGAGQHQLRVESSTLPRGVTVSTPVYTINVEGGQTATVNFQVGTFGGVLGHVTGLDANGNPLPLENVKLRIDGGAYSQTDTTGAYGFGGLSPGVHEVDVVESTVPAFATFDPTTLKQKVTVSNGQYSTLDFKAQPLGSISGKIVFAPDVADEGLVGGVINAYVVAEPGEHAAIDQDDGTFIVDNLQPGDYTLSVDNETLPEAFGAAPDQIAIHLGPGEHYEGAAFTVGHFEKKVVFSLMSGVSQASAPAVHISERRLPPSGSTLVSVDAAAGAQSVGINVFGQHIPLTYDKTRKVWVGEIEVPEKTPAGQYDVTASASSGTIPTPGKLQVDPKMPLAILTATPRTFGIGANVKVSARFLVDVKPGDRIEWEDGTVTVLGKPVSGRVFTFGLRVSLRPLHGVLLTEHGRLPIELL